MSEEKKQRIMVVDDDSFLLGMYSTKFKGAGFDIELVADANDAISKLKESEAPDAILIDIIMPTMSGMEFVRTLRKENIAKESKLIFLTNQNTPEDMTEATKSGVVGYIVKASAIPSEVVDKVKEILNKK